MVIVGGIFEVEPEMREQFLSTRHELMRSSREEQGCLEYTFSADPLDPARVILFERWASKDDLDVHLARGRGQASPGGVVAPKAASITVYEVAREWPLER